MNKLHGRQKAVQQQLLQILEEDGVERCGEDEQYHLDDTSCRSSRILPNRPPQHFTYRGIFFSSVPPNNAVLINGHPALLTVCMPDFVEFVTFSDERNFSPPSVKIDSRHLHIFLVNNQNASVKRAPVSAITDKGVILPYNDDRLFLPILHTLVS